MGREGMSPSARKAPLDMRAGGHTAEQIRCRGCLSYLPVVSELLRPLEVGNRADFTLHHGTNHVPSMNVDSDEGAHERSLLPARMIRAGDPCFLPQAGDYALKGCKGWPGETKLSILGEKQVPFLPCHPSSSTTSHSPSLRKAVHNSTPFRIRTLGPTALYPSGRSLVVPGLTSDQSIPS